MLMIYRVGKRCEFNVKLFTSIIDCTFTIRVINKLSIENFYDFRSFFQSAKNIGSIFIVDFGEAEHIDVSGLAMLLMLQEYIDNLDGKVYLVFPDKDNQVNKMLKLANFDKFFEIKH